MVVSTFDIEKCFHKKSSPALKRVSFQTCGQDQSLLILGLFFLFMLFMFGTRRLFRERNNELLVILNGNRELVINRIYLNWN